MSQSQTCMPKPTALSGHRLAQQNLHENNNNEHFSNYSSTKQRRSCSLSTRNIFVLGKPPPIVLWLKLCPIVGRTSRFYSTHFPFLASAVVLVMGSRACDVRCCKLLECAVKRVELLTLPSGRLRLGLPFTIGRTNFPNAIKRFQTSLGQMQVENLDLGKKTSGYWIPLRRLTCLDMGCWTWQAAACHSMWNTPLSQFHRATLGVRHTRARSTSKSY